MFTRFAAQLAERLESCAFSKLPKTKTPPELVPGSGAGGAGGRGGAHAPELIEQLLGRLDGGVQPIGRHHFEPRAQVVQSKLVRLDVRHKHKAVALQDVAEGARPDPSQLAHSRRVHKLRQLLDGIRLQILRRIASTHTHAHTIMCWEVRARPRAHATKTIP